MSNNPKDNYDRITHAETVWTTLRPNKTFAGMTLEQFRAEIAPSLAARATIARLDNELLAALTQRDTADLASLAAFQRLVHTVIADPNEGPNGELYEALGYVRASERKSGLSRKAKAVAIAPAA